MPDYDLGRATGEIIFVVDSSGIAEAQAEVGGLTAEMESLSAVMGEQDDALRKQQAEFKSTTTEAERLKNAHEGLRQRQQEAIDATKARTKAEQEMRNVLLDVSSTEEKQVEAINKVKNARRDEQQAAKISQEAYRVFRQELEETNQKYAEHSRTMQFTQRDHRDLQRALRDTGKAFDEHGRALKDTGKAYDEFNEKKDRTRRNVREASKDFSDFSRVIRELGKIEQAANGLEKLASAVTSVRQATLTTLAGGSIAGSLGLLGGGGVEGVVAMVGALSELVGVIGLLPGVIAGAGAGIGTLIVGLHGVTSALGAMGDPQKFVQSLREVSPVARQALLDIQQYYASFRGAMYVIQDELFKPILADISPLVQTYLPLLMNYGSQIANVFGQAGHLFASWLETPATIQTIQQLLANIVSGFQAALPAVQAFSNAFLTISTVGSGFFKEIGSTIARIATEFNQFIDAAAKSGQLQAFIQGGITAFGVLFTNIKNVGEALFNIFTIGNQFGGGFLELFRNIGQEFLNWTRSTSGQQSIASFFQTITAAGAALHPILREIGSALATTISALVRFGTAIGPGLTIFFHDLSEALHVLSPLLIQAAPAFNIFLNAVGQLILNVVQALGPALPQFLINFATAAQNLVGPATVLAGALSTLLSHLTPEEIKDLIGLIGAFELLRKTLGLLTPVLLALNLALDAGPLGLFAVAVGVLAAGIVLLIGHFGGVSQAISGVKNDLKTWAGELENDITGAINSVGETVARWWRDAEQWGGNVIHNMARGIHNAAHEVSDEATQVAQSLKNLLGIHSPAEEGPLSGEDSSEWGANLVSGFASGMNSASGSVSDAGSSVAGSAQSSLTSQTAAGTVGGGQVDPYSGTQGSGFDRWIKQLTGDLSAWSHILRDSFHVFSAFADLGLKSVDTFARLWQGGINPLTAPGGIDQGAKPFIPPGAYAGQTDVPGVPKAGPRGQIYPPNIAAQGPYVGAEGNLPAEDPNQPLSPERLRGLGLTDAQIAALPPIYPAAPTPGGGQGTPGGGPGQTQAPAPTPVPAAPPSASQPIPTAPGAAPAGLNAGQAANVNQIITYGKSIGLNDDQIKAALAIASDESHITDLGSNTSGGNAQVGGVTGVYQQSPGWHPAGATHDINTFLDTFKKNLDAQPGADPLRVAVGVQQHGAPGAVTPWQGTGGDQWYLGQVQNAIQNYPDYAAAIGQLGRPGGGQQSPPQPPNAGAGPGGSILGPPLLPPNVPNVGGVTNWNPSTAIAAGIQPVYNWPANATGQDVNNLAPPWLVDMLKTLGGPDLVASTSSRTDGGLHGTAGGPGFAFDIHGNAAEVDKFVDAVMDNPALRSRFLQLIRTENTEGNRLRGIAGGVPVGPGTNYPDYFSADWAAHGGANDPYSAGGHVHVAFGGGAPVPVVIPGLPGAPPPAGHGQGVPDPANPGLDQNGNWLPGRGPNGGAGSTGTGYQALGIGALAGLAGLGTFARLRRWGTPESTRGTARQAAGEAADADEVGRALSTEGTEGPARAIPRQIPQSNLPGEAVGSPADINATRPIQVPQPGGGPARIAARVQNGGRPSLRLGDVLGTDVEEGAGIAAGGATAGGAGIGAAGTIGLGTLAAGAGIVAGSVAALFGASTAFGSATGQERDQVTPNAGPLGAGPSKNNAPQNTAPAPRGGYRWVSDGRGGRFEDAQGRPALPPTQNPPRIGGWFSSGTSAPPTAPAPPPSAQQGATPNNPVHVNVSQTGGTPVPQTSAGPVIPTSAGNIRLQDTAISAPGAPGTPTGPAGTSAYLPNQRGVVGVPQAPANTQIAPFGQSNQVQSGLYGLSQVGNAVDSVFASIDSVIQSVQAGADLAKKVALLPKDSEDVVKMIQDVQQFIKTAAQIAKTVSDVAGAGAGLSQGDPTGITSGAFQAVSAIAGLVSSALSAIDQSISLGIEVYHEVGKYVGDLAGFTLGGANTGWLGGNVQMLLNTNTGQLYTYSADNPLNKNVLTNVLGGYTRTNAPQQLTPTIGSVNVYAGPGQSTQQMMTDTMWMVNNGSPAVVSAAGKT